VNNFDTAIICFTEEGKKTAQRIKEFLPSDIFYSRDFNGGIKSHMEEIVKKYPYIVFVSAAGIAVRMMAPFIVSKYSDPAVVTVSDTGKFAISLLSGHLGGANELTEKIAGYIGAVPVITTASDNRNYRSLDLWMRENNLKSINKPGMTYIMTEMADGKPIKFINQTPETISIPDYKEIISKTDDTDENYYSGKSGINTLLKQLEDGNTIAVLTEELLRGIDFHIRKKELQDEDKFQTSDSKKTDSLKRDWNNYLIKNALFIKPYLNVGMGCRKGKTREELLHALEESLEETGLDLRFIKSISSAEIKKEEKGLKDLALYLNVPLCFYTAEELNETIEENGGKENFKTSEFVGETAGVPSVSEAAALRSGGKLILRKRAMNGITVSIAREEK